MTSLVVEIAGGQAAFRPGEEIRGAASWVLEEPAEKVELRLFWHTQGKGDQDVGIVESIPLEAPAARGRREFALRLPDGPYSFSGKLISLIWSLEVVALPGERAGRADFVLSPTGREVLIGRRGDA